MCYKKNKKKTKNLRKKKKKKISGKLKSNSLFLPDASCDYVTKEFQINLIFIQFTIHDLQFVLNIFQCYSKPYRSGKSAKCKI